MKIRTFMTHHLVKSEDLNHHGTLFAGRSSEWFVESAFIAVSTLLKPHNILCRKIHGLNFLKPVYPGNTIGMRSRVVCSGTSSLVAYVDLFLINDTEKIIADGFFTFINVDENGRPQPHGIVIEPSTDEEIELNKTASGLKRT